MGYKHEYSWSHSLLLLLISEDSGNNIYCTITYKCDESVGYFVCVCVFFFEKNSKAMLEQAIFGTPNPTDKRSKKKKKKFGSLEPEGYVCYFTDLELQVFRW